jgi:hypothetical protein
MHEYTAKVAAAVAGALEPGETVVAATPAAPHGAMRAIAHGDGVRRPRVNPHLAAGLGEVDQFGVAFAAQYVIVLTDRRVVWFRTTFTGRPKAPVGALARGELDAVVVGDGRVLGQRYTEVRIRLRDGRQATFEVARVHGGRAEEFVAACNGAAAA